MSTNISFPHYSYAPYTKFNNAYALTSTEVTAFESYLNTPTWGDLINSLWRNEPIQNVCSLTIYPFDIANVTPDVMVDSNIYINNKDTGIASKLISNGLVLARVNICNKQIIPYFNNFLDYAPYTRIEVFIPFLGIIELSTSEFMGKVLRIDYVFDFNSGMASVYIMADEVIKITKMAQVGQQIPIGSSNQRTMFQSLLQGIGGLGTSAAAPFVMPRSTFSAQMRHIGGMAIDDVKSTVNTISNMQMETTVRGDLTNAFLSYYTPNNVYIIYTRPTIQEPSTYKSLIGKPSLMSKKLNQCFGFTQINSIHLENFDSALTEELTEIENLLTQGIILEKEDSIELTTPILTDLSTTDICKFSFPNDSRAYAYRVYVDGVEMGYPLNWSATLEDDVYTVTMNNNSFPDYKTYSITVQAYARQGTIYKDSDISSPLSWTKSKIKLTTPILTDLSTTDICKFSFPNDSRAYAYRVYVDGVEMGYPLNWSATLENDVYTVTMNNNSFPDYKTYSITVQAYSNNEQYENSDISSPLSWTKATSTVTVTLNSAGILDDAEPDYNEYMNVGNNYPTRSSYEYRGAYSNKSYALNSSGEQVTSIQVPSGTILYMARISPDDYIVYRHTETISSDTTVTLYYNSKPS